MSHKMNVDGKWGYRSVDPQFLEWLYFWTFGSIWALEDDEGYPKGEGLCLSVCRESRCQFWWVFDHQKLVFSSFGLVLSTGHRGGVLNEPGIGGNLSVCLSSRVVPSLVGFRWGDHWLLEWLYFRWFWLLESSLLSKMGNESSKCAASFGLRHVTHVFP